VSIVIAFLFRHDLGVYVGGAALLTAALSGAEWRERVRAVAQVSVLTVLVLLPYGLYLHSTTGIVRHVAAGIAYSQAEARRTVVAPPAFRTGGWGSDHNLRTGLFYTLHLIPFLTFLVVVGHDARADREDRAMIIPIAALGEAMNIAFLRDPLQERLPDPVVTTCILAAWLAGRILTLPGWRRAAAAAAAIALSTIAVHGIGVVGRPAEQLDRAGLMLPRDRWLEHARERFEELRTPLAPRQFPSRVIHALVPFIEYVGRCTSPQHRLFVAGNAPEVYVFARRLFAGGQPMVRAGFFDTVTDQRRLVLKMRQEDVPIALVLTDSDINESILVRNELESEFVVIGEIPVDDNDRIVVRANRKARPVRADAATGFPCYTPR
jgi:hypothetical protein